MEDEAIEIPKLIEDFRFERNENTLQDDQKLAQALPIIASARKHVDQYPGNADDAGTNQGRARLFGVRCVDNINGSVETSDAAAAAAVIGEKGMFSSHVHMCLNVHAAIALIKRKRRQLGLGNEHERGLDEEQDDLGSEQSDDSEEDNDNPESDGRDAQEPQEDQEIHLSDFDAARIGAVGFADGSNEREIVTEVVEEHLNEEQDDERISVGTAKGYRKANGQVDFLSLPELYSWRGGAFEDFNLLDWFCCTKVVAEKKTVRGGAFGNVIGGQERSEGNNAEIGLEDGADDADGGDESVLRAARNLRAAFTEEAQLHEENKQVIGFFLRILLVLECKHG